MEPLLRGDPMEPVSSNSRPVRYAPSEWVDLIRQRDGDEISATRGRGKYRSMRMLPSELAKSTARIISPPRRRPESLDVWCAGRRGGAAASRDRESGSLCCLPLPEEEEGAEPTANGHCGLCHCDGPAHDSISFPLFFDSFFFITFSTPPAAGVVSSPSARSPPPSLLLLPPRHARRRPALGLELARAPCPRHRAGSHGDSINPPSPQFLSAARQAPLPCIGHGPQQGARFVYNVDCAQTVFSWFNQYHLPK